MSGDLRPVIDQSQLHVWERVLVQSPGRHGYAGVVDDVVQQFALVWVRESITEERKIVLVGDSYIYRSR